MVLIDLIFNRFHRVRFTTKLRGKYTVLNTLWPTNVQFPQQWTFLTRVVYFCARWIRINMSLLLRATVCTKINSWCVHSKGFQQSLMTFSCNYVIMQNSPKNILCSGYLPSTPILTTTDFSTASLVFYFSFAECHIICSFSIWLLSVGSLHVRSFHMFAGLDNSFRLVLSNIPLTGSTSIYLLICWRTPTVFPCLNNYT